MRGCRGVLGEGLVAVEREVAEDLVGGDVVQPRPVGAHRLEQRERAHEVRLDEGGGVGQRVVVVGLRREVHHGVAAGHELVHQRGIGDATVDELDVAAVEVGAVAGVGQRVEHDHLGHPALAH